MKKHIPDMLTLSRVVLFAPLFVGFMLAYEYELAAITYGIGLATNCLDGYLARRWNAFSKYGGSVLQPACDMVYATVAVWLLIATEHWPFWIGVMLFLIAGVLQLISYLAGIRPNNRFIQRLKRHQGYIHPLYSVIVMTVAWWSYVYLANRFTAVDDRDVWAYVYVFGVVSAMFISSQYVWRLVKESRVRA